MNTCPPPGELPFEVWETVRSAVAPYAIVSFEVSGEPIPKKRRIGQGRQAFTPERTRKGEEAVVQAFRQALTQPWEVEYDGTYGALIQVRTSAGSKVDLDNAVKLVWDALNKQFWGDDVQVGSAFLSLLRGRGDPGLSVVLFRVADNGTPKTKICECGKRFRAQARRCASCIRNRAAVRTLLIDETDGGSADDDSGRLAGTELKAAFSFIAGQLAGGRQSTAAQVAVRLCTSEPRARTVIQSLVDQGFLARKGRNLTVVRPYKEAS